MYYNTEIEAREIKNNKLYMHSSSSIYLSAKLAVKVLPISSGRMGNFILTFDYLDFDVSMRSFNVFFKGDTQQLHVFTYYTGWNVLYNLHCSIMLL